MGTLAVVASSARGESFFAERKRVEKQKSSRPRQTRDKHYIFVELKREKAFPLGGKNYKKKKLNWEEGGGAADE